MLLSAKTAMRLVDLEIKVREAHEREQELDALLSQQDEELQVLRSQEPREALGPLTLAVDDARHFVVSVDIRE